MIMRNKNILWENSSKAKYNRISLRNQQNQMKLYLYNSINSVEIITSN